MAQVKTNWSRRCKWTPSVNSQPGSEREVVEAVEQAANTSSSLRPIGTGHSFTSIAATDGISMNLDRMNAVLDHDSQSGLVKIQPGITIHQLGLELASRGLALKNQGDIDHQTIAGAVSTGTHGTGLNFGNLSSSVVGLSMVDGQANVRTFSLDFDPELTKAARVSLGSMGVITDLTLQTVPAFRLHKRASKGKVSEVLSSLDELASAHDHFEFYCLPYADDCLLLQSNRTYEEPQKTGRIARFVNDEILENQLLGLLMQMAKMNRRMAPVATKTLGTFIGTSERLDDSHSVYASKRRVRFNEMEYAVPLKDLGTVVGRVLQMIKDKRIHVAFPIEVRVGPADDSFLSSSAGRQTGYIAVHQLASMPYNEYFNEVEKIVSEYQARPHWGKLHTLKREQLSQLYPDWLAFEKIREAFDPNRIFQNPYTQSIFG